MARGKRGRGPPLSYEQKYKQIKRSKFDVDIPAPTTPSAKAMVTRYHKYLYNKAGQPTSFHSKFRIYKGKNASEVAKVFRKPRGARRIQGTVIEKGTSIKHFTKEYVDVQTSAHIVERRYKFNKKKLLSNAGKEIKRVLGKSKQNTFQLYIGGNILKDEYHGIEEAIQGFREFAKKYKGRRERIGILSYATRNQRSNSNYRRMIRRGKKN